MKLASIKHDRDGRLVIVNSTLTTMTSASDIATTLQFALDNWDSVASQLEHRYQQLEKWYYQHERNALPAP